MSRYRVNKVKATSPARRYEVLRIMGVQVRGHFLKGQELDDYLDREIWAAAHPGKEPVTEWDDGLPAV